MAFDPNFLNISPFQLRERYNISPDCEINQLQPDGTVHSADPDTPLQARDIVLLDRTNTSCFPCSHALLTDCWQPEDYIFVFAKGTDQCTFDDEAPILLQRGMLRFGCQVGLSIDSIVHFCNMWQEKFKPITCQVDCLPDSANAKALTHTATYDVLMLRTLAEGNLGKEKIYPTELQAAEVIEADQLTLLQEALSDSKELIETASHQSSRPFQCKTCKSLKEISPFLFNTMNEQREIGEAVITCPGDATSLFNPGEACSMASCPFCLSSTKTCTYCVDGATGEPHLLARCTDLMQQAVRNKTPLPLVRMCECKT